VVQVSCEHTKYWVSCGGSNNFPFRWELFFDVVHGKGTFPVPCSSDGVPRVFLLQVLRRGSQPRYALSPPGLRRPHLVQPKFPRKPPVGCKLPRQKSKRQARSFLYEVPGTILSVSKSHRNVDFLVSKHLFRSYNTVSSFFFVCGLIRKLALLLRCKSSEWHLDSSSAMQDWGRFWASLLSQWLSPDHSHLNLHRTGILLQPLLSLIRR
jgi:hypothetical protein